VFDPKRPIREADIARRGWHGTKVPLAAITLRQELGWERRQRYEELFGSLERLGHFGLSVISMSKWL
jgi:hypothetical protein